MLFCVFRHCETFFQNGLCLQRYMKDRRVPVLCFFGTMRLFDIFWNNRVAFIFQQKQRFPSIDDGSLRLSFFQKMSSISLIFRKKLFPLNFRFLRLSLENCGADESFLNIYGKDLRQKDTQFETFIRRKLGIPIFPVRKKTVFES